VGEDFLVAVWAEVAVEVGRFKLYLWANIDIIRL